MKGAWLTLAVLAGCGADKPVTETSEVGITVLPVASASIRPPLGHVQPTPAHTTPGPVGKRETAEQYFNQGRDHWAAGRFQEACAAFQASYEAEASLGTLLNLGNCNEKLGNVEAACNAYRDAEVQAKSMGQDERSQLARARAQNLGCR